MASTALFRRRLDAARGRDIGQAIAYLLKLSPPGWFALVFLPIAVRPPSSGAIELTPLLATAGALWLMTIMAALLSHAWTKDRLAEDRSAAVLALVPVLAAPAVLLAHLAGIMLPALLVALLTSVRRSVSERSALLDHTLMACIVAVIVECGTIALGVARGPTLPLLVALVALAALLARQRGIWAAMRKPGLTDLSRHHLGTIDLFLMALVSVIPALALGLLTADASIHGPGTVVLAATLGAPLLLVLDRRSRVGTEGPTASAPRSKEAAE